MYHPSDKRYDSMVYRRCGNSGLKLPAISLGLWHNFGDVDDTAIYRKTIHTAFDNGITHFDLANNYGPPPGSAEVNFGKILKRDFSGYLRDEIIISSKAGYKMWNGPYGDWGSRKYLLSSLDQSLERMGISYVDIFYSHRPDPETPMEETMMALDHAVRSGKALYAGISNYDASQTRHAIAIMKSLGTPIIIHQPRYNMFDRWVENGLLDILEKDGLGCIPFSPLAQGLLTNKYLHGIPQGSRADLAHGFLKKEQITPEKLSIIEKLNALAEKRGQTLAQMALAWLLEDERITSVLVGASSATQLLDSLHCLQRADFSREELAGIETILKSA